MDPRTALLLSAAVGALAVILDRPQSLGLLAGASAVALALAPIPARRKGLVLLFAASVIVSTAWTQGLFYAGVPRTALVRAGPVSLWREGIAHGAVQALRLVATAVAGLTVALSIPTDRLFLGLVGLRVPHGAAFLAVTALRAAPIVAEEWATVRAARNRRHGGAARLPWTAFVDEMRLLGPIAARSVRRARTLAESLELRGFDPVRPRRTRVPLRMRAGERWLLAGVWGAVGLLGVAAALYAAYVRDWWWSPALRPLYGAVRTWL